MVKRKFSDFEDKAKLACYSEKNVKKTSEISIGYDTKVKFICDKCHHEFETRPFNVVFHKRWCPYCCVRSNKLCKDDNCTTCLEKSFASYDKNKVSCWSEKNKKKPHKIFMSSNDKYFFDCDKCNFEFEMIINNITFRDSWCPICSKKSNKNMNALFTKLDSLKNITYSVEDKVFFGNRKFFFDIKVEHEGNVFFIESDGKQHFDVSAMMNVSRTKDEKKGLKRFKEQRTRDLLKEDYIMESGKLLFRISYRQLKDIPKLVDEMLEVSKRGEKGVSYMDSLYFDWELIE